MGFDLGGLIGGIGGGGSPIGGIIDAIGGAVGLPKEVTNAAKIGQAFFTGDVLTAADGAMGLAGSAMQKAPPAATTETPSAHGAAPAGYAEEPTGPKEAEGPKDPSQAQASKATQQPAGPLGDIFGFLFKVPTTPIELFLGPHLGMLIEGMFGGGAKKEPAPAGDPDAQTAAPPAGDEASEVHEPHRHRSEVRWTRTDWDDCRRDIHGHRRSDSDWDSKFNGAVRVLHERIDLLDTAAGIEGRDGVIGRPDLEAAMKNPDMPDDVKRACRFLLDNPAAFNMLDVFAGNGTCDGLIRRGDVEKAFRKVAEEHDASPGRSSGVDTGSRSERSDDSGRTSGSERSGGSSSIDDMFRSGMCLEDIVMAILERCMDRMDDEIEGVVKDIDKANRKAAGSGKKGDGARGADGGGGADKATSESDKLQQKLQRLMEKRQQVFQLMSTMSSKFNESAKTAIQNLGRA